MPPLIPRYLVENHGPDKSILTACLESAVEICRRDGITRLTFLVPAKGTFGRSLLAEVLGPKTSRLLADRKAAAIGGIDVDLESVATFSPTQSRGLIVGVYIRANGLDVLDSVIAANAIMVLPWTADEGKAWKGTWNPRVIGRSTWEVPPIDIRPEAEDALKQLTEHINLSTYPPHPSDKEFTERTFEQLRAAGLMPRSEEVRRWAMRNGCGPEYARALEAVAERYQ